MSRSGDISDFGSLRSALQVSPDQRTASHLAAISASIVRWPCFQSLAAEADETMWTDFSKTLTVRVYGKGETIVKPHLDSPFLCVLITGCIRRIAEGSPEDILYESGTTVWTCAHEDDTSVQFECVEQATVAVVEKVEYMRVVGAASDRRAVPFVKFISELPFFCKWKFLALARLRPLFREVEICRHTVLYREGAPATDIFIIRKGEVELMKAVKPDMESKGFSPRSSLSPKTVHISILTAGETLGLEEALTKSPRTHTAVCKSLTASLLCVRSEDFIKKVVQSSTWEQSRELLDSKAFLRSEVYRGYEKVFQASHLPHLSVGIPSEKSLSPKASPKRITDFGRTQHRENVAFPSTPSPPKRPVSIPRLLLIPLSPRREPLHMPSPDVVRSHSHRKYPRRKVPVKSRKSTRLVAPTDERWKGDPSDTLFDFSTLLDKREKVGKSVGRERLSLALEGRRIRL